MIFVRTQQRRVSKLAGEESQSGWLDRQDKVASRVDVGCFIFLHFLILSVMTMTFANDD